MAVVVTNNPSSLKLRLDCGPDEVTGKTKIRTKSYGNVKPAAVNDDLFNVATAIEALQEHSIQEVIRVDSKTISE